MLWKHLAKAGLINGSYSGIIITPHPWSSSAGVNVPASRNSPNGWISFTTGPSFDPNYNTNMRHSLSYGKPYIHGIEETLTIQEIWNIDNKIDDAKPSSGEVLCPSFTNCANSNTNAIDSEYVLTNDIKSPIVFRDAY